MPEQCVNLLKETGNWDTPYKFAKPHGYKVVSDHLPNDFNKLDKLFKYTSLENLESQCSGTKEEDEFNSNDEQKDITLNSEDEREVHGDQAENIIEEESKNELADVGGRNWKVSSCTNGSLTYENIKQALKLLLPREYISRCRQRRHWASKYLPGKEPVDPKHDIFKYCGIALKVTQDGKSKYKIGRVEAIESTKDGSEVISFQLKGKAQVRIRCSLYSQKEDDVYAVSEDVLLTSWKSKSSIIENVDLQPLPGKGGKYTLHPSSKESLLKLGILPYNANDYNLVTEDDNQCCTSPEKEDEYYEVEDVIDRRLSKDAVSYEYKVRFKGYGSEDDMWLPASFFNRAIQFVSTSKFGRKRKHTLDPENVIEDNKRAKRVATNHCRVSRKREISGKGDQTKRGKTTKTGMPGMNKKPRCTSQKTVQEHPNSQKGQDDHTNKSKDQGKVLPSSSRLPFISNVSEKKALQISSESDGENAKPKRKGRRLEDITIKVSKHSFSARGKKSVCLDNRSVELKKKRKTSSRGRNKGKLLRSSLQTSKLVQETVQEKITTSPSINDINGNQPIPVVCKSGEEGVEFKMKGVKSEEERATMANSSQLSSKACGISEEETTAPFDVIKVEYVSIDKEVTLGSNIMADLLRFNDNFSSPRRLLSQAPYPEVDGTLRAYEKITSTVSNITDPITVTRIPPQSVLREIEEEYKVIKSHAIAFKFPCYGTFDREGIRVLGRFH